MLLPKAYRVEMQAGSADTCCVSAGGAEAFVISLTQTNDWTLLTWPHQKQMLHSQICSLFAFKPFLL